MILRAKKKTSGNGPTVWEADKGDLVNFPDDAAKRLLKSDPKTWEVAKDGDKRGVSGQHIRKDGRRGNRDDG